MLGMVVAVRAKQGDEYSGSGVGSAFDRDSELGTFNGQGCKRPAYTLN